MSQIIEKHLKKDFFSDQERKIVEIMLKHDQSHIFDSWHDPGNHDHQKKELLNQLIKIEKSYPGGIGAYIRNAIDLLAAARQGNNPYAGYIPQKPQTTNLSHLDGDYQAMERLGMESASGLAVVMVAGGLGERLGYQGIKIDIPLEVTLNTSYLDWYCHWIAAMQSRLRPENTLIPFIIMTSEDTHSATLNSLEKNDYFSLQPSQVHILKQELVPALANNQAHFVLEEPYQLLLKPHGHGDIHMLLYASGLVEELSSQGKTHLVFIQDTNGQVFNAVLATLGASIANDYDFNSIVVPRIAKEAVGAITKLKGADHEITINVEYNQLDALLKDTISPAGDVPGEDGLSVFPGNINVLMVKISSYLEILRQTKGIIAEFVNPKYADESKSVFKKPTRLETMMQDLPKLFSKQQKVGVTVLDRKWCFSPDKNNIADAAKKAQNSQPPESAATAESDFYLINRKKLALAGMRQEDDETDLFWGVSFSRGARVVLHPRFAITLDELRQKIQGGFLSRDSTLCLSGKNIRLENVSLLGNSGLLIEICNQASLIVKDVAINNDGFKIQILSQQEMSDDSIPQYLKIRGYRIQKKAPLHIKIDQKGDFLLGKDLQLIKLSE